MYGLEIESEKMKNLHMLNSKAVAEIIKPLTKAYYSTRTRNVVLGGSTILYLNDWTDKLPHDLDIVVYKPSMMQIRQLEYLRAMNADINYASDYNTEGMDHYVVKTKVGENTIDFIVYPNTDKPEGLELISFADDEISLYKQTCENIVAAKLISAREKDYLQLSAMFKYMAENLVQSYSMEIAIISNKLPTSMTLKQEDLDKIALVARYSTEHTSVYSMDQEFINELLRVGKLHGFECSVHRSCNMIVGVIIKYAYFNLLGK